MAADGLRELGRASLLCSEAGDEVAGFAFEFIALTLLPFPGDTDELALQGVITGCQRKSGDRSVAARWGQVPHFNIYRHCRCAMGSGASF